VRPAGHRVRRADLGVGMSFVWHWLGADDGSGHIYLVLSGFLGCIGVLATPLVLLRKHNCEVHGCLRLGRHDTAAGHTVCRHHHPDPKLTVHAVHRAHWAAQHPKPEPPTRGRTW